MVVVVVAVPTLGQRTRVGSVYVHDPQRGRIRAGRLVVAIGSHDNQAAAVGRKLGLVATQSPVTSSTPPSRRTAITSARPTPRSLLRFNATTGPPSTQSADADVGVESPEPQPAVAIAPRHTTNAASRRPITSAYCPIDLSPGSHARSATGLSKERVAAIWSGLELLAGAERHSG